MRLSFVPVKSASDQEVLARMAGDIWRGYWPAIIGEAQTEYMVDKFQSLEAIRRDMAEHDYEYWFLVAVEQEGQESKRELVGFTGGHDEPETNRYFISKIYLYPEARGRGFARKVVEFYEDLGYARGFDALYLTVNKYNDLGIRAYKGTGFNIIDAVETDIGEGFIMDDYIMQLNL